MTAPTVHRLDINGKNVTFFSYGGFDQYDVIAFQALRLLDGADQAQHYGNKPVFRAGLDIHSYGVFRGDMTLGPSTTYSGLQTNSVDHVADYTRYYHMSGDVEFFDTICHMETPRLAALVLLRNAGFGANVLVTQNVQGALQKPNYAMGDKIVFPAIVAELTNCGARFAFTVVENKWGIIDIPTQVVNLGGYDATVLNRDTKMPEEARTMCVSGAFSNLPLLYGGVKAEVNIMGGRIVPLCKVVWFVGEDHNNLILLLLNLGSTVFQAVEGNLYRLTLSDDVEPSSMWSRSQSLTSWDSGTAISYEVAGPADNFLGKDFIIRHDDSVYKTAHNIKNFEENRWIADEYSKVEVRRAGNKRFSSRAASKFCEMDLMYGLTNQPGNARVLHTGAAPGGSLEYYADRMGWTNQVVNHFEGGDCKISATVKAAMTSLGSLVVPGTGDLTKPNEVARVEGAGPYHLVMADASSEYDESIFDKEEKHFPIFKNEVLLSLLSLRKGGSMIVKFFGGNHYATAAVILLAARHFMSARIVKPFTSRPTNGERFLVCVDFIGLENKVSSSQVLHRFIGLWVFNDPVPFALSNDETVAYVKAIKYFDRMQDRSLRLMIESANGQADITATIYARRDEFMHSTLISFFGKRVYEA